MERNVTRRELAIAIERVKREVGLTNFDVKPENLQREFDDKLGLLGAMLMAEIKKLADAMAGVGQRMTAMEQRMTATQQGIVAMEPRMTAEMARQTRAAMEWARAEFRVVDDQYSDLPKRVSRLERKVFPPKRARSR